jgi:hypothetical protein
MRRIAVLAAAAALTVPGLLAISVSTAVASDGAPAPTCDSSLSTFECDASSPGATTWTVAQHEDGIWIPYTITTSDSYLKNSCDRGFQTAVSYSYVSGGVTYYSGTHTFTCNANPPP